MAAPSYHATSMLASADPASAILSLIEVDLAAAGWQFVEEYSYTAASTPRSQRVWRNPSTLNAAGVDFYIALARNASPGGAYLSMRCAESWNTSTKVFGKPCIAGTIAGSQVPLVLISSANGQFFAFSSNTTATATSLDGVNWKAGGSMPAQQSWKPVAYGNGTYVTVSANVSTNAASSTDGGITWTQRTMPTSVVWNSVAYGNGTFCAVSQTASTAATSPDGVTWTSRTGPAAAGMLALAFGAGLFAAVGGSACYTSPDGVTWTSRTLPAGTYSQVLYAGGQFVAVGNAVCATSSDGIAWTSRSIGASGNNLYIAYGNGKYVAVASGGATVSYSSDAITWSQTSVTALGVTSQSSIAFGAGTFVTSCSGAFANPPAVVSTDGVNWTASGLAPGVTTTTTWVPAGGTPAMADPGAGNLLSTSIAYDVAVLASKSYVAVTVNKVGTGTQVFSWVAGLYNPAYTDSQASNPPLMMLSLDGSMSTAGVPSATSGVARTTPRSASDFYGFAITAAPESLPLGQFTGVTREPATQSITGSRVALLGGGTALNTNVGLRGWLYDAVAVAVPPGAGVGPKVGDSVTSGAVTYYALGQSAVGGGWFTGKDSVGYFFDVTAGS